MNQPEKLSDLMIELAKVFNEKSDIPLTGDMKRFVNILLGLMTEKKRIVQATLTCNQAADRHGGQDARNISRMCLRGQYLAKRYGGVSRVPTKKATKVIFAVKLGRSWQIPLEELDRVFLGKQD